MGLNCKPGDIAIFVRSKAGNEGRIVTCLRLATEAELAHTLLASDAAPWWVIDQPVQTRSRITGRLSLKVPFASDRNLRPIRPGDLTQEEVDALYLPEVIKQRAPEAA